MKLDTFFKVMHRQWAMSLLFLLHPTLSFCVSQFKVDDLPGSPPLPRSWAGRLPVPDTEQGNSLFFWLFETEDIIYDDNLIIWFAGGPGCSSLVGLTSGNGPISFVGNSTNIVRNPYSWTKLGHVLYVDQPVGTGLSTSSYPYPIMDNDRVTSDLYNWLKSFFEHFPHLRSKRVHMIGESYAGIYIPYLASEIVKNYGSFPINLQSLSMGDGTWGNGAALSSVGIGTYLRTQRKLLNIPDDILAAFAQADHRCGFDTVLQNAGSFPPQEPLHIPGNPQGLNLKRRDDFKRENELLKSRKRLSPVERRSLLSVLNPLCNINPTTPAEILDSILNNSCYGPCATFSTALNYLNAVGSNRCIDVYDIKATCDTLDPSILATTYFSRADVQTALNIPPSDISHPYLACNMTVLAMVLSETTPTPPAYSLLPNLVTNNNIPLHFYQGEYDMLINHFGTELSIQNMTWSGAQGFSERPDRAFYANNAAPWDLLSLSAKARLGAGKGTTFNATQLGEKNEAGLWASERGVTYHLFRGAGHSVFVEKPMEMFAYVRDVVIGGSWLS